MIQYPFLEKGMTIGVTAPSSGVPNELHGLLHSAFKRMEEKGYNIQSGDTPWTQDQAKSAPAKKRAEEFNAMMLDNDVDLIIPPWGGELLAETLEYIDFNRIQNKWVLGYSDISLLLLAVTLNTGIATAHGTNLVDLRGDYSDETTAMWESVLFTEKDESVLQHSSEKYQKEWDFENPTPHIFNLSEETYWKTTTNDGVNVQGRLLGGCVDTIRHLIGTPYGDVKQFKKQHISGESVVWFFENCDLPTTDLRRTQVQMKLAGLFDDCECIMFGRSAANTPVTNYTVEDIYQELADELQIPIIYDIDCGHLPPQITFVNGAYAEIVVRDGKGQVVQTFES